MKQVTISVPTMANWRTTLFGLVTAGGGAAFEYFQGGGLSWKGCAVAVIWAAFCFLVPDAGESATKAQLAGLVESLVAAKLVEAQKAPAPDAVKVQ